MHTNKIKATIWRVVFNLLLLSKHWTHGAIGCDVITSCLWVGIGSHSGPGVTVIRFPKLSDY